MNDFTHYCTVLNGLVKCWKTSPSMNCLQLDSVLLVGYLIKDVVLYSCLAEGEGATAGN